MTDPQAVAGGVRNAGEVRVAQREQVRLVRRPSPVVAGPAALDPAQAAVVARRQGEGPLVVLGAPGTGVTTALVEAVVARVERDGVPAGGVLVLAATRPAAAALRDRISARLARTVREPLARTPHSYAFGLLRRAAVLDGDVPPRLISGAEQDRILAELLAGHEAGQGRAPDWPPEFGPQIRCLRGFRDELRDLLMRAVERGLGPPDLADLGRRHGRPAWVAAAGVLAEYLDVTCLATPGAFDPAAIVDTAALRLADDPELLAAERGQWQLIAVDDAQEATAATQRLLDALAGGGHELILAGDPDTATQGFRGARPQLLAEAPHRFARADGTPAPVVVLGTVHRHGPALREVAVRVVSRIGSAGTVAHRTARPAAGDGVAEVHLLPSVAQEAAFVAQRLRRHHLEGALPWSAMAVVVRSSRNTEPLRRALAAAGVPVSVPAAELPVRDEPAVVPLRLVLRCVVDPGALVAELAVELLGGPIGGMDAVALRRLRQALRAEELAGEGVRASDELLVEALADPARLVTLDPRISRGARRVAAVLAAGREAAAEPGANAETVLWRIWEETGLAEPWQRQALAGGTAGARADRALDAVVAFFEAAARYTDRLPRSGPAGFLAQLEGQDVPADTLAERAPDTDAVALVTAQGAAGREWEVVAVTGVQEGSWPDLRLRSSLLGAQGLADLLDGRAEPSGAAGSVAAQRRAVLDEELRLFHVAVTRARSRLLVTAVRAEDELPSPFLDLVAPLPEEVEVRPVSVVPRAMTLPAVVADLRAHVVDPQTAPAVREAAAARLARLAAAGVPGAHPDDWYGLHEVSSTGPLRAEGQQVRVSPSKVEQFDRCALRWLLEVAAGGTSGSSSSQALGDLVHELAELEPSGDEARLRALLAERIGRLGFGRNWVDRRQAERLQAMVAKFARYAALARAEGRELVAVEQPVEVRVGRAVVRGTVDRLERDVEGRLVVVDLKTGAQAPSKADLARHAQLGVYQVAIEEGGFDRVAGRASSPDGGRSGGGRLVQLGTSHKGPSVQVQGPVSQDPRDPHWARTMLVEAAEGMAGSTFAASGNPLCRTCKVRRSCPLRPEGRQVGG
ncbi:MAG TPA: ATP-dependent DNA helicase [Kineosporiaceae bacterium]|nr:ATP-dependent DNA helicase [Kineosporiaceae bacterium]